MAAIVLGACFSFATVSAQVTDDVPDQIDCANITRALKLGSRDANTGGDVSTLQTYLSQANYLDADPTGYYGRATFKAVQAFQKANGITPQGNVGPYTRAKIKEVSCGNVGSISTFSAPVVMVSSTPSLKLGYDASNKEASLTATYSVTVTASTGGDFKLYKYGTFDNDMYALSVTLNSVRSNGWATNGSYYKTSGDAIDNGSYMTIPKGQTATFSLTAPMANPKSMFAGRYNTTLSLYKPSGVADTMMPTVTGNVTSNSVVIIGETSPYITGAITCDATTRVNCTIKGIRFDQHFNVVTVNGVTKTLPSFGSGSSMYINFQAADFNITQSGVYTAQVTTNDGASNFVGVHVNSLPGSVSIDPTIEVLDTPTLSLKYESVGKDSWLVGKAKVKITAGGAPVTLYQTSVPYIFQFNNALGATSANSMTFSATDSNGGSLTIPANTAVTFYITNTARTSELFAGSYSLRPSGFNYVDANGGYKTVQSTSFKGTLTSNSIVIVGETSPYITSASADSSGFVNIAGRNFDPNYNNVTLNGITKQLSASVRGDVIPFAASDFGITGVGSYIVQVATKAGASNRFNLVISSVPSGLPTAEFRISAPGYGTISAPGYGINVRDITYPVGTPNTKSWNSTGGSTYSAKWARTGTCTNPLGSGDWTAYISPTMQGVTGTPANGTNPNGIGNAGDVGCVVTLTYTVTNSAGVSVSDTIRGTVTGAPTATASFTNSPTCMIPVGAKGCSSSVSWTSSNVVTVALTDATPQLYTNASQGAQSSSVYIPYGVGTYQIRNGSVSGAILATVSGYATCVIGSSWNGSSCASVPASPVAVFTISAPGYGINVRDITYPVGTPNTKSWNSTGGSTYSAKWARTGTCTNPLGSGDWTAYISPTMQGVTGTPANGTNPNGIGNAGDVGCVVTLTYTVTNSAGVSASDTIRGTVTAAATSTVGVNGYANDVIALVSKANDIFVSGAMKSIGSLSASSRASAMSCIDLKTSLHRGNESSSVIKLQEFLYEKGLLTDKPSGFFGDLTIKAVKAYQKSIGLPETGMVFEFTREAIKGETCINSQI